MIVLEETGTLSLLKGLIMHAIEYLSVNQVKDKLNHGCDGPITPFVLISRAIQLAAENDGEAFAYAENIANALDELLTEYGWLKDGLVETGS